MRRKQQPHTLTFLCLILFLNAFARPTSAGDLLQSADNTQASYRVPVDLVWQQDHIFVANSRTGSVSKVDPLSRQVIAEWKVAESLSGLASWSGSLLLLDDHSHRLISVTEHPSSSNLETILSIDMPPYPVDIAVAEDESVVAVSSLWSRTVTLLDGEHGGLRARQNIDLPFAPRMMMFLPDEKLVVADSFGGHLLIIDARSGGILKQHDVYGHNIRGLSLNHKDGKLLVACQTLDASTFTTYERVFWGVLMQNGLHSIPLGELLSESGDASDTAPEEPEYSGTSYASQQRYPLGTPSIGSGDPGAITVTKNDTTLVLVSGVNQVAFRTASHLPFERLKTGRRPEAICLDKTQQHAFIANRFDDSITVVSLASETPVVESTISLGEVRELTLAEQGEQTFYDASVSLDGWFSCHSCHTDGHTNGLRADTFGDEDRGAPKKVASLLGTVLTGPWAWNGSKSSLDEQIKTSLIISMQTQIPSHELPIDRLTAFLKALAPAPSLYSARRIQFSEALRESAWHDFDSLGCRNCHSGDALTSADAFDVGIHDEMGETSFNPPSLRGVSQRAPYFHDGRATSLADVLKSSHHNKELPLSDKQVRQLTMLLESL